MTIVNVSCDASVRVALNCRQCPLMVTQHPMRLRGVKTRSVVDGREQSHAECPFVAAGSTGRRNTGVESLCWGFKLQGLTWSPARVVQSPDGLSSPPRWGRSFGARARPFEPATLRDTRPAPDMACPRFDGCGHLGKQRKMVSATRLVSPWTWLHSRCPQYSLARSTEPIYAVLAQAIRR